MENFKKYFTLIELIVAIVVLGILAAIVLPNISSIKGEAEETAIISNIRNVQTAVDMFTVENDGVRPTKESPTFGNPQTIELHALKPDFIRDIPKNDNVHYWLDEYDTVWASTVDSPTNVKFYGTEDKLTWDSVENTSTYKIYKTNTTSVVGSVKHKRFTEVASVSPESNAASTQEYLIEETEGFTFLVSAIDSMGLEAPPTPVGSTYEGFEMAEKGINILEYRSNLKPIASIEISPNTTIYKDTIVSIKSTSNDPEGEPLQGLEWKLNGVAVADFPETFPIGKHEVSLRVKDSMGKESDWVTEIFSVVVKPPMLINGTGFSFTQYTNTNKTFIYQRISNVQPIRFTFTNDNFRNAIYSDQETYVTIWEDGVLKVSARKVSGTGSKSMYYTYYPTKDDFELKVNFRSGDAGISAYTSWTMYQYQD